jgi:membrane protease subunit HflC
VRQFYVSVQGDEEAARRRLSQTVRANLAEEFNKRTLNEAISTSANGSRPRRGRRPTPTRSRSASTSSRCACAASSFRPMSSVPCISGWNRSVAASPTNCAPSAPRNRKRIRADADRQRQVILADAYRAAQKIKGEGDGRASIVYANAYGQNPEFYSFYRSLEAYKSTFRNKSDLLVLDPSAEFFQYFKNYGSGRATKPPAK